MNVRTVDAHVYGGAEDFERIKRHATEVLNYFVNYCHHRGLAAKAYLTFGTDPSMFHLTFPTAIVRFSVVKEIGHAIPPFRRPFP